MFSRRRDFGYFALRAQAGKNAALQIFAISYLDYVKRVMKSSNFRLHIALLAVTGSALVFSAGAAAQSKGTPVPKVGTIKDYPATGLMTGCGNLYVYKAADADSTTANYVFLSRGDGSHAWMNLNGRDVRLRKTKSGAGSQRFRYHSYRYGNVHITVETKGFTPRAGRPEHMFKMKITLRKGRAVRVVHAIGDADC